MYENRKNYLFMGVLGFKISILVSIGLELELGLEHGLELELELVPGLELELSSSPRPCIKPNLNFACSTPTPPPSPL